MIPLVYSSNLKLMLYSSKNFETGEFLYSVDFKGLLLCKMFSLEKARTCFLSPYDLLKQFLRETEPQVARQML